jgi:hypothetical protein
MGLFVREHPTSLTRRRVAVDSVYYKVIGFVVFFPWLTVALIFVGYFRERWARRARPSAGRHLEWGLRGHLHDFLQGAPKTGVGAHDEDPVRGMCPCPAPTSSTAR